MRACKAALLVLAGLGFAFPICAQFQTDDEREEIRANKIKTIERRLYDPSPNGMTLGARLVMSYDRQGNLVESTGYTASGALRSRSRYKYEGNRLVEYVTEPAHEVFQNFTGAYKLDQDGRVIEATYHQPGGKVRGSQKFTRDNAGRIVEETSYDGAGRPQHIQRRRYDSDGNAVEWISMNGDGSVVQRREYTFRRKGQQSQELAYDSSNRLVGKSEYVYAGEHLAEVFDYFGDGKLRWRVAFERNASGLALKETMFQDGKVSSVEEITYEHHP
jgi:YD repeat-containing protein